MISVFLTRSEIRRQRRHDGRDALLRHGQDCRSRPVVFIFPPTPSWSTSRASADLEPVQVDEVIAPLVADPGDHVHADLQIVRPEEYRTAPCGQRWCLTLNSTRCIFRARRFPSCATKAWADYYKHHGIYAYRLDFLASSPVCRKARLEKLEALEQLRALEYGYKIKVVISRRMIPWKWTTSRSFDRVRRILQGMESTGSISQ